jgi:hypothetical protein
MTPAIAWAARVEDGMATCRLDLQMVPLKMVRRYAP